MKRIDGRDCYIVESTPKRSQVADDTRYSERAGWIDKESFVALHSKIYDHGGALLKRTSAEEVELVDPKKNAVAINR